MILTGSFLIFTCHPFYELEPHSLFSIRLETYRFLNRTERLVLKGLQIESSQIFTILILIISWLRGSVLAPLLFLFYINNLAENLSNDAVIALFTDDVSILTTARKKEDAVAAAQSKAAKVYEWSRTWKLNLNTDKRECCPFSTQSKDSKWYPSLTFGGQEIRVDDTPRLLGVILDRSLSFNAHVKQSNSHYHQDFELLQLQHMLPGVGRNLY